MENKVLTMMEVSQKQAYIFSSNKLQDNITNSAVIARVLDNDFFEKVISDKEVYDGNLNMVYSGGGHTILEFRTREQAVKFTKRITRFVYENFEGLIIFATTIDYNEALSPGDNCKNLTAQLEAKKALRSAAFHQGSFGIEKINATTFSPESADGICEEKEKIRKEENESERKQLPQGYDPVYLFSDLGGSKYNSNFIAVVHIDGNAMGKRVENIDMASRNESWGWNTYKEKMRNFSNSIDLDFKNAYKEMEEEISASIESGVLDDLELSEKHFPVRRIITAGDDICFVSEGRIGIECAVRFIEKLSKKVNAEDKEGYAACAGVAIVHQKYPFYKAYELAENLCANAKKYGASLSKDGSGKEVSVIDWHIEFGEIKDTLDEIRDSYKDMEGHKLNARPYLISSTDEIMESQNRKQYTKFKKMITELQKKEENFARGKLKELRGALKRGRKETDYFLKFNKIEDIVINNDRELLFDVIELLDTYLALDGERR